MKNSKKIIQKLFHSVVVKILIGLIICIGIVALGQEGLKSLFKQIHINHQFENLIISIIVAFLAIISYSILFRYYEKRKIIELSTKRIGYNLSLGIILGVILQILTISVIYFSGNFSITSYNGIVFLLPAITLAFNSAIFEEILFRGIIFRLIEEKLGSYIALAISAIIFGGIHLANPNSSIYAGLGLAIQAGLLLGAAYIYSKNLWFPIAIHFAWNFTQSGIFGASTSGRTITNSLLTSKIQGSQLITGGQFGPEGSIQATLFCLIATIILVILCHKQNKIISPYWKSI